MSTWNHHQLPKSGLRSCWRVWTGVELPSLCWCPWSAFFDYKNFHSIVLLAVCDAKYCFTFPDIGDYGGTNDARVLSNSVFGQAFDKHLTNLNLPSPCGEKTLPYVLVGNDIFPLKPWLMKPFPGRNLDETQRVYNYRLSRARHVIENAFGILTAKSRIFRRPIKANIDLVEMITKASCTYTITSGLLKMHDTLQLVSLIVRITVEISFLAMATGEAWPTRMKEHL